MKFFESYRSKRKIYYEKNCSYLYEHSNDACYSWIPSALAQTESQFYDQWYEDTSWKLAKCYYNWNSTGCLGCAGINEEFITAYEYYKSVYPNSKYLAQYTNLYNSTVANKAMYDAMDESQRHIVANGYQAPCSGYFGQMTRCNGDTAFYNFYCDDGSIVENVQVSISNFGKVDNVRYDNIGFIFWSIEALNRDGPMGNCWLCHNCCCRW